MQGGLSTSTAKKVGKNCKLRLGFLDPTFPQAEYFPVAYYLQAEAVSSVHKHFVCL